MGFGDVFKKIKDFVPIPDSSAEFKKATLGQIAGMGAGNVGGGASALIQERFGGRNDRLSRTLRMQAGVISPGVSAFAVATDPERREKWRARIKGYTGGGGERPPPVAPAPGQGANTETAKREARLRARRAAGSRFGFAQTISTSPLGLQGEGAAVGRKRLLGE